MLLEKKILHFLKGPRKGEAHELRAGLVSQYKLERKDAIERTIQAMTVGKDVLALFPDVLKNIATHDLEQKKLVYLYLMNYAKSHPELCILAVNTFVQDTEDVNPLVRALAIRTMGCIRVDKMVDYMEIPLRRTLQDDNPYVRKTAAVCVAKLFDLSPQMCVEHGFLEMAQQLVHDPNPMVVANALGALLEIADMNRDPLVVPLRVDAPLVRVFLACLNECTEWGRITILACLAEYEPTAAQEALHIVERSVPQLQHANPAVVLAAIKVIVHHLDSLNEATRKLFLKKLAAPMVSLVSLAIPEAQYVGLRNIRIVLEKYPQVLARELRVFFLRYLDPLYLKLEKLAIVVRLACDANCAVLLAELREYAMEIEPVLVTRAVAAIGAVAIQLPSAVVPAVNLLVDLLELRGGPLIVNEAVAVLTQVLRRYPRRNDLVTLIVPVVARHAPLLTEPHSQAAHVFLLGEYPRYFSDVPGQLRPMVESFLSHEPLLQLALLTAVVKVSLAAPSAAAAAVLQTVLETATRDCDAADVRDRAYIYWRLLSSADAPTQALIAAAPLPPIKNVVASFNPAVLDALMRELGTLASVFHKPAATFIDPDAYERVKQSSGSGNRSAGIDDLAALARNEIASNARNENLLDFDDDDGSDTKGLASAIDELADLFAAAPAGGKSAGNDIMGLFDLAPKTNANEARPGKATSGPVSGTDVLLDLI